MSEEITDTEPTCRRHEGEPLIGKCVKCGTPICRECRGEFGYFCSPECLNRSRGEIDHAARAESAREIAGANRLIGVIKLVFLGIALLALAGIGYGLWRAWLRPAGKLVWQAQCSCSFSQLQWLAGPDRTAVLRSGGRLARIAPDGIAPGTDDPELAQCGPPLSILPDGALYAAGGTLLRIADGTVAWRHAFAGEIAAVAVADAAVVVAWQVPVPFSDADEESFAAFLKPRPAHLAGMSIADGKILWEKELKDTFGIQHLAAAGGQYLCSFQQQAEGEEGQEGIFRAGEAATGKDRWQVKTSGFSYGLPPRIAGDTVLFHADGKLVALSADGRTRRWELAAPDLFDPGQVEVAGDAIFLSLGERFVCISLPDGKIRWEREVPFLCETFTVAEDRLYLLTAEQKSAGETPAPAALPPAMDELEDMKDINSLIQRSAGAQASGRMESVLLALDAATGEERWRCVKLRGDVVAAEGQVFMVTDSARHYGGLLILGGGPATTTVRSLDPRSGRELFARSHPFSMTGPYRILGGNLLGVIYDGEGARGGTFGSTMAEATAIGVAAIRGP
jgi:outer membrane protein assembly factor BamB